MKEKFERIIRTRPPFDKRTDNPSTNYGIGSMRIKFVLKGRKGAVQILLGTKLYLAKQFKEWRAKGESYPFHNEEECLTCWDVGFHSKKKPSYMKKENKTECEFIKGGCYYDGSGLRGDDDKVVDIYLEKGDEGIWEYLEKYYLQVFGSVKV